MSDENENTLKDFELRSEEVQEILSNPPSWMIRWGITVVFLVLLLIIGTSCIVEYPDVVTSKITITTEVPVEKIEAKTSGRIIKLLIKDQEQVKHNQILAVIENTANYKDIYKLKSILDTISLQEESFYFPYTEMPQFSLVTI